MRKRGGTGKREEVSHSRISDSSPDTGEGREGGASKRIKFGIFILLDGTFKIIEMRLFL